MNLKGRTNAQTIKWDTSDFPLVCEPCLGKNPYIRMSKADFDLECRICFRPYTVFRWKSDNGRFKRTEICQTCAKVKHVCQGCILDLKFGLPMELRDKYLKESIHIPKDPINRDYWAYKVSRNIDKMNLPYDNVENYTILDRYLKSKGVESGGGNIDSCSRNEAGLTYGDNNGLLLIEENIVGNTNISCTSTKDKETEDLLIDIVLRRNKLSHPDILNNLVRVDDYLGEIEQKQIQKRRLEQMNLLNTLNKVDNMDEDKRVNDAQKDSKDKYNKKKKYKRKNIPETSKVEEVIDNDPLKFSKL